MSAFSVLALRYMSMFHCLSLVRSRENFRRWLETKGFFSQQPGSVGWNPAPPRCPRWVRAAGAGAAQVTRMGTAGTSLARGRGSPGTRCLVLAALLSPGVVAACLHGLSLINYEPALKFYGGHGYLPWTWLDLRRR